MKCFNLTSGKMISENLLMKDTFLGRLVGLLATRKLAHGHGIVLKPCTQIHTMFMRFSIDVVFVSKNFTVVKVMQNMCPWRFSPLLLDAYYTIELSAGTLNNSVKKGDNLQFEI